MSNPFTHKFTTFSANLSEKNAAHTAQTVTTKSGEVFADKPFTIEYRGIYSTAKIGQSVAQVITFLTTAALGVFALTHIVPLWFGIYIAVPLGLLFAFGVEKIKRSTLAIAAKHYLKYGEFGAVGIVALLVMLVSIGCALYGAKELPGVVYAQPQRTKDLQSAQHIQKQVDVVQFDINRLQTKIDGKGGNWVAENRTLPKLQKQRAELINQKAQVEQEAGKQAETEYSEALTDRAQKVDKMQVYAVVSAIIAELIFLFCTGFILYYLFRHYAEQNPDQKGEQAATFAPQTNGATFPGGTQVKNGKVPTVANMNATGQTFTLRTEPTKGRSAKCLYCANEYEKRTTFQKYCSEQCRVSAWETNTGRNLKKGKHTSSPNT
jgi:hypothetical protein